MQQKTVTITIDEDGNSAIDLDGFEGNACGNVLKDFRGGDEVRVERNKPAFWRQAHAADQVQTRK